MLRFIKTNDEQGCVFTILLSDGVRTITGLRLALTLPDAFASSFPSSYVLPGWHGDQLTFSFFLLLDSIYPTLSFFLLYYFPFFLYSLPFNHFTKVSFLIFLSFCQASVFAEPCAIFKATFPSDVSCASRNAPASFLYSIRTTRPK